MASLRKRRGKWYARIIKWDGSRQTEVEVPLRTESKVTARQRLSKVEDAEADIKSGVITDIKAFFKWLNKERSSKVVRLNLVDSIDEWLESRGQNNIRATTLDINERALGHFVNCLGRNFPAENISLKEIREFRETYLTARGYSPTTVNMWLRSVRAFLNWLVENELIKESPRVKQIHIDEPEVKYLSESEIAELMRLDLSPKGTYLKKDDLFVKEWEHYKRAFNFYLTTGCRKSEPFLGSVNGMWLDIPPNQSKNHKARTIRLTPENLKNLKEMRARAKEYSKVTVCADSYSKAFKKACRVIGLSEDIHLHSLRHTFACIRRLQTNGNMPLIRDELGHKDISTTQRYIEIPLKRLQEDFPTYSKTAKNGIMDTDNMDTEPINLESAPR